MGKTGGWTSVDAEAGGGHPEVADILLRLEKDDVDFWSKEATQDNRPTETDRDAHGGSLHLWDERAVKRIPVKPQNKKNKTIRLDFFFPQNCLEIFGLQKFNS